MSCAVRAGQKQPDTSPSNLKPPMGSVHHRRSTCRICGSERLRLFLSLGPSPLANSFLSSPDDFASEASYPLDTAFCEDCALVQLMDVIDPGVLFRDYIYVTGTSDTIAAHNSGYAATLVDCLHMTSGDLVVEVASNDGSLLKAFQRHGVRTLGIEPATNIAAIARQQGVETVNTFFHSRTAAEVKQAYGPAKAVVANNVLAHVDDPVDFLKGAALLLEEGGMVVAEVPYAGEFVARMEYDTIYHEHLCYFSITALARLFEQAGLALARVDHVPVHGGSVRVYAQAAGGGHAADAQAAIRQECGRGLTSAATYERFGSAVEEHRSAVVELLEGLRVDGHSVAGYGAPAKGNTLLNYCGIGTDLLPYTVDKNPLKVGKLTPGMHIPVLPVSTLLERQPDFVFILAWNFADEIIAQQREYQARGGRFIVPVPRPVVI
jgi:hypothetical protein